MFHVSICDQISSSENIVVGMSRKRLEASKVNLNDFDIFMSPF